LPVEMRQRGGVVGERSTSAADVLKRSVTIVVLLLVAAAASAGKTWRARVHDVTLRAFT